MWGNNWVEYYYDENGVPSYMLRYDERVGLLSFFVTDLQGDVIAMCDNTHALRFFYHYDAWGKLLSVTDVNGNVVTSTDNSAGWNTLLYRGYVYDRETGLYYLNSRYYDPETGRFISADAYVSTGNGLLGYNMYAYCDNNPVMKVDPSGTVGFFTYLKNLFFPAQNYEVESQFTEDRYTLPDKMSPYTDFQDESNNACFGEYTLLEQGTFRYDIPSSKARTIEEKTLKRQKMLYFPNQIVWNMLKKIGGGVVSLFVNTDSLMNQMNQVSNYHVANGTYTTIVGLYGNESGPCYVAMRTYSSYDSDYNSGWVLKGYSKGKSLADYAAIQDVLPIQYYGK